jgi:hypothetical protein
MSYQITQAVLFKLCSDPFLSSGDIGGGYQWAVQTPDGWTLYLDPPQA